MHSSLLWVFLLLIQIYGCHAVRRISTVAEALEEIQKDDIDDNIVVILPPEAGDCSVDSDVESMSSQLFETTSEVEIEYEEVHEDQIDNANCSDKELTMGSVAACRPKTTKESDYQ